MARHPDLYSEVKTMLKKLIRSNLDDLWLFLGVEGGVFLLVEVIIGCVMFFARPVDGVSVAWIMLPIIAGFVSLMTVTGHVAVTFDLALRFGQTRRRAMGLFLGLSCFETAFGFVLAAVLSALEWFVCPFLWARLAGMDGWVLARTGFSVPVPDMGTALEPGRYFVNAAGELTRLPERTLLLRDFTLAWYWWLLIFAIALAGGIIIGALIQRFGQKGLWVIWGCCMAPSFATLFHLDSLILPGWLNPYSDLFFPVVLGLLAAGLFLWAIWSLLHAVVRA